MDNKSTPRQRKFEALQADALARADQAERDGASEAVVAYLRSTADHYRRQALQPRAVRRSNTTGRKS